MPNPVREIKNCKMQLLCKKNHQVKGLHLKLDHAHLQNLRNEKFTKPIWASCGYYLQELLNSLHERYEDWLMKKSKFGVPAQVVVSSGIISEWKSECLFLKNLVLLKVV